MKCFSICETAEVGLLIVNQPLDGEVADPAVLIGSGGSHTRIGLGKSQRQFYIERVQAQHPPTRLSHAEIDQRVPLRLIKERSDRHSDQCIVHVATAAGAGGELWWETNTFEEVVKTIWGRPRVVRAYGAFPSKNKLDEVESQIWGEIQPPIEVLATGHGENWEPQALLRMVPGASFRICRTGELCGLSPVLIVAWTGSVLRVFPPKKYASLQEAPEASAAA